MFLRKITSFNVKYGVLSHNLPSSFIYPCFPKILKHNYSEETENSEEIRVDGAEILRSDLEKITQNFTQTDWHALKSKLTNREYRLRGKRVTSDNVDGIIMSFCEQWEITLAGQQLYKHLVSENKEIHVTFVLKYLKILAREYLNGNAGVKEDILTLLEKLDRDVFLDATSLEQYIFALSLFEDYWRKGLELLNDVKVTMVPRLETYSSLISAAFKFGDPICAWNLWDELVLLEKSSSPNCFLSYFEYCKGLLNDGKFSVSHLETLLNFCETHDILLPNIETVTALQQLLKEVNKKMGKHHTMAATQVQRHKGVCGNCRRTLSKEFISNEQFSELKTVFLERAVIGKNAYLNTNPKELERFQNFIDNLKPYHIVVDGLNIALGTQARNPQIQARKIQSVVQFFKKRQWNVLVLGRRHMQTWPREEMTYIRKTASVFLAENNSQDDPFLLLATLHGGPDTCFISDDFMRGHRFRLKDLPLRKLFRRWQMAHQFRVNYAAASGHVDVLEPLSFVPAAQKRVTCPNHVSWHVPYNHVHLEKSPFSLEPPQDWICLNLDTS